MSENEINEKVANIFENHKKIILFFHSRKSRVHKLIPYNKEGNIFEYDGGSYTLLEPFSFWLETPTYIIFENEATSAVIDFKENPQNLHTGNYDKENFDKAPNINEVFDNPRIVKLAIKSTYWKYLFKTRAGRRMILGVASSWILSLLLVGFIVFTATKSIYTGV